LGTLDVFQSHSHPTIVAVAVQIDRFRSPVPDNWNATLATAEDPLAALAASQ
jgi:hypothetical protein